MNNDLIDYIKKAKEKNLSNEQIKDHLVEIGWSNEKIIEAIAYASDLPVPPTPPSSGPILWWFGVSYLLFFVSLFLLMVASGNILHNWIDKPLLTASASSTTGISASSYDLIAYSAIFNMIPLTQIYIPAIIISYSVALFLAIFLKRQEAKRPLIKENRFYRLLFSTTLIITFLYTLTEIIVAGFEYLSGNPVYITLRHAVVILLTSGIIFVYCATEIKHWRIKFNKELVAFIYITFFAVIALIYGFKIIPSALTERGITYDHKRIINLGQITNSINSYYQDNFQLPQSLDKITTNANDSTTPLIKVDPQTNHPYQYVITGLTTYKVCANFSTASSKDDPNGYDDADGDYANYKDQFPHPAGYHCFDEDANASNDYPSDVPSPICLGSGCPNLSPVPTAPSGTPPTPTPFVGSNTGGKDL